MTMTTNHHVPRHGRGFTLVELMLGMAIGLAVVVLALGLLGVQLQDTRRQLTDLRLTHDLQTIAELISRDLARAGHGMPAGTAATGSPDPVIALPPDGSSVSFDYAVAGGAEATTGRFGYRLRRGVIEMAFGDGSWQALSDASSMRVTRLEFVPDSRRADLQAFCSRRCDAASGAGAGSCPYQLQRRVRIRLRAQAATGSSADSGAPREAEIDARVRNDAVVGGCPA
jgi:prepilin-type N-terminal cleavage/methylation domain-containing protein